MKKYQKVLIAFLALSSIGAGAAVAGAVSASTNTGESNPIGQFIRNHMGGPKIAGTVSAVNGNTITLTGKNGTTYTVDVTNAKIEKFLPAQAGSQGAAPASITAADIKAGDNLLVAGTLNGTSVSATNVFDGNPMFGGMGRHKKHENENENRHVKGTVTAVNGNSVTITAKDGKTFTIDASSTAEVEKVETVNVSDIKVGDDLDVRGSVSGTSVSAKSIFDGLQLLKNKED